VGGKKGTMLAPTNHHGRTPTPRAMVLSLFFFSSPFKFVDIYALPATNFSPILALARFAGVRD
jgi:hypothetical protein